MKRTALAMLALWLPSLCLALEPISDEQIATLHWMPQVGSEAMSRTRALELWLAEDPADLTDWRRQVDLRQINLDRQLDHGRPALANWMDGRVGWLIQARQQNLAAPATAQRLSQRLLSSLDSASAFSPITPHTRFRAEATWARFRELLRAAPVADAELEIAAFWSGLQALAAEEPEAQRKHALAQVERARAMGREETSDGRLRALAGIADADSVAAWERGDGLTALWSLFESLMLLLPLDAAEDAQARLAVIGDMMAAGEAPLRAVDTDFPILLAQLHDAAEYMASSPPLSDLAARELLDAYFRLAFFVPDAAFYLDQPVRDHISQILIDCEINPDLVGPLPRQLFEQCPERLVGLLREGLSDDELVGVREGPFAPEFLRRELGLLSWQRARYLDGYLNWALQASCQPPEWVNVVEWSILVDYLSSWVPQRPVFFATARWQEAVDDLLEEIGRRQESHEAWLDCITGHGGQRRDPVSRLIRLQTQALNELEGALQTAYQAFLREATRPGADIDLAGAVDQLTAYRPEGLSVMPCAGGETCGARVELPVSRALLGLFPNTFLLADQLGIGRLGLCYDNVRWVDRSLQGARPQDPQVANYFGRLSFELVGTFDDGGGMATVFRQRLTSAERSHYLFAEASDDLLAMDCPISLSGLPVASRLPPERRGLVPDRLTYFVATPVTADGKLSANWDRGAEWRDWFLTDERVEIIESPRPDMLQARVQAEMEALNARRERRIAASLLSAVDQDPLGQAMAVVSDTSGLIRRVLEIHYPRLLRHDGSLRAAVVGTGGLVGREQVRQFRDTGEPLTHLARNARARLLTLQSIWEELPDAVRERGQPAPETDIALHQLKELQSLTRSSTAVVELLPEP